MEIERSKIYYLNLISIISLCERRSFHKEVHGRLFVELTTVLSVIHQLIYFTLNSIRVTYHLTSMKIKQMLGKLTRVVYMRLDACKSVASFYCQASLRPHHRHQCRLEHERRERERKGSVPVYRRCRIWRAVRLHKPSTTLLHRENDAREIFATN